MAQDIPHLARLLRSFFNATELREFLHTLEDGDELLARMPSQASSLVETCNEAASLIDRWGMTDAELLSKLMQRRPTRVQDLMSYCRLRASAPTTVTRRSTSIEMTASIEHLAVGVYRLHPGQVKTLGRSSECEKRSIVNAQIGPS